MSNEQSAIVGLPPLSICDGEGTLTGLLINKSDEVPLRFL